MWAWMDRTGRVAMASCVLMLVAAELNPEWAHGIYEALPVVFVGGLGLAIVGQSLDPEWRRIRAEQQREFLEGVRGFGQLVERRFYGTVRGAGAIWRRVRREWRGEA